MATKPTDWNTFLDGQGAVDASFPLAQTPRGGMDFGFSGITTGKPLKKGMAGPAGENGGNPPTQVTPYQGMGATGDTGPHNGVVTPDQTQGAQATPELTAPFAGLGPWLEGDDETVYNTAQNLVLRQELLALNRLACDQHFTAVKLGAWFSQLTKDQGKSIYKWSMPDGMATGAISAVPNKAWDLCNKATETVLVDFPAPDVTPLNDSEQAQASAQMAQRYLDENSADDQQLFYNLMDKALPCATAYVERWTDPMGGGYVPLQILAHPQAESPDNPLVGLDGMPTTDLVLRYVTAPQGGQFTNDPEQAAPQWQPKIRAQIWFREHIRTFPEDVRVEDAEKVIIMGYCTLADAKRRWPDVAAMGQDELNALLNWTPPRFLVLLPPFQQARWKVSAGADKEKQGSSDERIMFYYRIYCKCGAENKRGADVVVTGAMQGKVLYRGTLSATVEIDSQAMANEPGKQGQAQTPSGKVKEVRCLDIPVTQVTPRADTDGRDPTGLSYMWLFAGATEFDAALATSFLEMLSLWTHPDSYVPSTSSVQSYQIAESRATQEPIPILRAEDRPVYGNQPILPPNFFQAVDRNNAAIDSIASLNKPVTGQDTSQEVSGKARQIAVQQAMVGLSRMQHPVNTARARDARIVLQLTMRDFTTAQLIRYVGEDGSYKAQEFSGTNFALIGNVRVKAGTGTMMPPDQKVQYLGNLIQAQMIPQDEAMEAARMAFAPRLGLPDDPHRQYIQRCVETWLDGPPEGWVDAWTQYQTVTLPQAQAAHQAQVQQIQQGPEAQQLVANGGQLPPPPPFTPPPSPWTPFQPRPNDDEPQIAQLWTARLSKVMSTVKYTEFPPAWRQPLDQKYATARQVLAAAQAPIPAASSTPAGAPQRPTPGTTPTRPPNAPPAGAQ